VIDHSPEVDHLAIQLHVHLVQVPARVTKATHARDMLATYVACEPRAEPVPPRPHRLVADIDPALEQQVLNISERKREPHAHHPHRGIISAMSLSSLSGWPSCEGRACPPP
jgi:hypothetical protein